MGGLIWRPVALALIAALLVGLPWAYLKGRGDGRAAVYAAIKIESDKRIEKMGAANAKFKTLTDVERCRVFMRDSGLPESACD